ncbi:uncharacterized protein LOC113305955 [Papaver somniferum]|uniref:uncharacterized protein LOC113305955 n=1 Tax=Papaver somniferum TaxID=3469 RepID=UPI000E700656|nr:uncharacterized protein LOC113305955 [Papaver somniferum]
MNDQRFSSLEIKLGQICDALNEREKGKLPSQPQQNPKGTFQASTSNCNETAHAVTTLRSGKTVDNNVGVPKTSDSESDSSLHTTPQKTSIVDSEHVCKSKNSTDINVSFPANVHVAPFPQRLVQQKKAIKKIPTYDKFLKDLCTQKRKLNVHKRAFLVEQLGLGELKPTLITLQLADRFVKVPPDTQPVQNPNCHIPVILGRPFLATSNAIIKCRNGVLKLSYGNMTVELNVFNASKQHLDLDDDNDVHGINMIESLIQGSSSSSMSVDPLHACLNNFNLDMFDDEYIIEVNSLLESAPLMDTTKWKSRVEPLPLYESKSVASLVEPPKLELKTLPDTLKYVFLGPSNTLHVIISSALDTE